MLSVLIYTHSKGFMFAIIVSLFICNNSPATINEVIMRIHRDSQTHETITQLLVGHIKTMLLLSRWRKHMLFMYYCYQIKGMANIRLVCLLRE